MKKITILFKAIILFVLLSTNQESYSTVTTSNTFEKAMAFEESILVYGLYAKYNLYVSDWYQIAVSSEEIDLPQGLTYDPTTGILEGVPELDDEKEYQSYDPYVIHYLEDGTTRYDFLGEYTILRPSIGDFQLIDTKKQEVIARTGYSTNTLTIDITDSNDFAIVAKDYRMDFASYYSPFDAYEANGIEAVFSVNGAFFKKERVAPYALNGDVRGKFNTIPFKEGTYEISVRFYSSVFQKYISESTSFTLKIIDNKLDALVLYPNPATDIIAIDKLPNTDERIHVTIIDIMTNTSVVEKDMKALTDHQLGIQELHPGVYVAQITHAGTSKVIEFIKK